MSTPTITERIAAAQVRVDAYLAAELQALQAQSAGHGDRNVTRANLAQIRAGLAEARRELAELQAQSDSTTGNSARVRVVAPGY